MAETNAEKAQKVEKTLETKGVEEGMKALNDATANMGAEDKRDFLESLKKANENRPVGSPEVRQVEDGNGNVDVKMESKPVKAGLAWLANKVGQAIHGDTEKSVGKAVDATNAAQSGKPVENTEQ